MFVPIRSDRPLRSTPYVNYALVVVNILMFIATTGQLAQADAYHQRQFEQVKDELELDPSLLSPISVNLGLNSEEEVRAYVYSESDRRTGERFIAYRLMLHKYSTGLWQFLTYQFLHSGPMHLIGNMIFLWVFGNNVEDRLGKAGYLLFYLSTGVIAGLAHWLTSDASVLGASGSVAGVTGAFIALFPRTRIGFLYFFILIGFFEVPALVVVLFFFAKDLLFYAGGIGNIAYTAHLGGTVAGFALGMGLLLTRLLPREPYDLLTMVEHRRRREKFRKITRTGYQPWEGRLGVGKSGVQAPADPVVYEARRAIASAAGAHDLPLAATRYAELLRDHPDQVLNERLQTDLANQLAGQGDYPAAATAYELLLKTYPRHHERPHLQLMLGLLYTRYLDRPADARPLLEAAVDQLHGDERDHARQVLDGLPQ